MKSLRWSSRTAFFLAVAAFYGAFFIAPVMTVFFRAVTRTPLDELWNTVLPILRSSRTASVVAFTVGQAAISAALAVVIALPGAYLISHYTFPGRRLLYSLSLLPFVLPSIVVVVAMISFYGKSGLINRLMGTGYNLVYNFRGIVLAHVFYNFSLAIRVIATAWSGTDRRFRESAESLGDTKWGLFFRVTLPLLMPAILTSFLLVFIYCFMSFGIVLVFGGVQYSTLEVAIYREMFVNLDLQSAAVFSLIQVVFSGAFIAVSTRSIHGARSGALDTGAALPRLISTAPVTRALLGGYIVFVLIFVLGPILTLIGRSFTSGSGAFGLQNYRELLVPDASARNVGSILRSSVPGVVGRSLAMAGASGTLTFGIAAAAALSLRGKPGSATESALQIPMGMSLVTVGLGMRLLWGTRIPPVVLVIAGQFFVAFPLVFRIIRSGVEELSDRLVHSAQTLGAQRYRILRDIEIPLLRRTFLNAWAYALALPFADLTIVMVVGRGRIATFPVAIYRLIGFRSFDLALALAVLYILVCLILFWIIDSTSFGGSRRT